MTVLLENSLLGCQTPRLCSLPAGVVSRAPGDAAVALARSAGLELDEWQQFVLREALGVRADGKWAAFSTCLIMPRQNGKGAVLEALALAGLFLFDLEYIVWTAHQMKTAKQGFQRLWTHIKLTPDLLRLVDRPRFGNDDRGIDLKDGRQIRFVARGGGSGLGFTADLVILDEALILDSDVMADLLPTLSAVPNPQIWYTSSAPRATSEQLHSVRKRGIAGDDPRLAFFEWSVEDATDPRSEASWALANPAYPHRVGIEAIEAEWNEFNADVDASKFCRERLGVPDELLGDAQAVPLEMWAALADPPDKKTGYVGSQIVSNEMLALCVSPFEVGEMQWASIGLAGRTSEGKLHVERLDHRPLTPSWIVDRCVEIWKAKHIPIRVQKESAFVPLLREQGVDVVEVAPGEVAQATGQFIDAAFSGQLVHLDQPSLNKALRGAILRPVGDGASVWSQRLSSVEITPLVAVTVALGGVPTEVRAPRVYSLTTKGR